MSENSHPHRADVLVLGAGPAGLLAAAACHRRGLDVRVIAPEPAAPWDKQLSAWEQELPGIPSTWVRGRWPGMRVAGTTATTLAAPYLAVDVPTMQADLLESLQGSLVAGHVEGLSHSDDGVAARLRPRLGAPDVIGAAVVVDARGALPGRYWQSAVGLDVSLEAPWTRGPWLMDFRPAFSRQPRPSSAGAREGAMSPTFCYVLPFTERRVLFEETVLMGPESEAVLPQLEARLRARLAGYGVRVSEVHRVERCRIPMDSVARPVPPALRDRVVTFGAAAGFTHPATGYQLGLSWRRAEPLADAIQSTVDGRAAPLSASVWPDEALAAHALYRFGAGAVRSMDSASLVAFFDAFFGLTTEDAVGYLARTLSTNDLRRAMWALFRRAGWRTRLELQRAAVRDPLGALRGVFDNLMEQAA